ncbi:MAG TPA: GGDEF domain-containing protein, partial [Verrucomicrobiae bacterium]|nr:GGDEF domain-containing protein [Verrucomicrobiae bacterium]
MDRKRSPSSKPRATAGEIGRLTAALAEARTRIAKLELMAEVDPLLNILNRRGFERALTQALAFVKRYRAPAALLYLDLDGFKLVNDAH